MRTLFTFSLAFLLANCTPKPTSVPEIPAPTASTKAIDSVEQDSGSVSTAPIVADSSLYIGEIWIFQETGELYTSVYYHDHLDVAESFELLRHQTDSLVYEDTERQRRRLPTDIASQYFNLTGFDSISVYKDAQLVCKARFTRVEYLDDVIESQFIAVFKPIASSTLPEQLDYCISSGKNPYKTVDVGYEEIEDEQLTKSLLEAFVTDSARVWNVSHTRIMPYRSVYSAISMQYRLLLIETIEGRSRILNDSKEDWFISDITPLHLEANGKPFLLLTMGKNETDWIWTSLAIFSGEEYVFPKNNRVSGL